MDKSGIDELIAKWKNVDVWIDAFKFKEREEENSNALPVTRMGEGVQESLSDNNLIS